MNVTTSETMNGLNNSTLKIEFKVTNPVVPNPSIYVKLPKSNINFMSKGTSVSNSLLYNSEKYASYNAQVLTGPYGSTTRKSMKIIDTLPRVYQKENLNIPESSPEFDEITLILEYASYVPTGDIIEIHLFPVLNPPSMNPVKGFFVKTGDSL